MQKKQKRKARKTDRTIAFICPICGNSDGYSIGYLNGKAYCRRCISFRGGDKVTYIVKREEKDNKGRFSLFELEIKHDVDIDNSLIKKAGGS